MLSSNATGKELFEQVIKTLGLREAWFFGLQYQDSKGYSAWIEQSEKVMNQDLVKAKYDDDNRLLFKFLVKYYPEDLDEEIIQHLTLVCLFTQNLSQVIYLSF